MIVVMSSEMHPMYTSHLSAVQTQDVVMIIYLATWIPFAVFPVANKRARGGSELKKSCCDILLNK